MFQPVTAHLKKLDRKFKPGDLLSIEGGKDYLCLVLGCQSYHYKMVLLTNPNSGFVYQVRQGFIENPKNGFYKIS